MVLTVVSGDKSKDYPMQRKPRIATGVGKKVRDDSPPKCANLQKKSVLKGKRVLKSKAMKTYRFACSDARTGSSCEFGDAIPEKELFSGYWSVVEFVSNGDKNGLNYVRKSPYYCLAGIFKNCNLFSPTLQPFMFPEAIVLTFFKVEDVVFLRQTT